jgi:hypothetical protein
MLSGCLNIRLWIKKAPLSTSKMDQMKIFNVIHLYMFFDYSASVIQIL